MKTVRLADDKKGIATAADILRSDGIVAIPTETVYGLAASAFSNAAIKKVFEAKGRPQDNPLIVHISDIDMIDSVVDGFTDKARALAEEFWPGPLTLVLGKNEKIAESVSVGLDTVAVRMPSNEVARDVIRQAGIPLAAPSANLSGSPSPTSAQHVLCDLDGKIDAVILSDECSVGVESTVVSLACNPPRLLRPGKVTPEELKKHLPDLVIDKAVLSEPQKGEKVASPGMKYKHYSPKTQLFLVEAESDEYTKFVNKFKNALAICFSLDSDKIEIEKLCYGDQDDAEQQAKTIFALLRRADGMNCDKIFVHAPKKSGIGLAVYNRLIRAAAFRVTKPKHIVGLTGPTGAGKSTLKETAKRLGFDVIDCDVTARKATDIAECRRALAKAFGDDILDKQGNLIRQKLAQKAFCSPDKTELLNTVIFPYINALIEEEILLLESDKVLLDAPTLFEAGADRLCDRVCAVLANIEKRKERIISRDGLNETDALLRINAGKPDEYYKQKTQNIIYNDSDEKTFIRLFTEFINGGN